MMKKYLFWGLGVSSFCINFATATGHTACNQQQVTVLWVIMIFCLNVATIGI